MVTPDRRTARRAPVGSGRTEAAVPYRLRVSLAETDRSTLLSLVAALHRRGVDVRTAALVRATDGSAEFTADFAATFRQAATVAASLRNLIAVLDAELSSPAGVLGPAC